MTETKLTMSLRVFRYDPDKDNLPRYDEFELSCGPYDQLLDALDRIKENQDSSLSFRKSCRHGICGSCAVRVNSRPVLACKTSMFQLRQQYGAKLTVDPLAKNRVLRDLVIDQEDYWAKYHAIRPYAETIKSSLDELRIRQEAIIDIADADYCINCLACYHVCPVVKITPKFLGPAAFVRAFRFESDPRDHSPERLRLVNEANIGVWDCVKCLQCSEVCPKGVDPFRKINALHEFGVREGVVPNGSRLRHAKGFLHAIKRPGIINELVLALYSLRLGVIRMVPRAVLMFFKRKLHLNPFWPRSRRREELNKAWKRKKT